MTRHIAVVTAGLSQPSSSRLLAAHTAPTASEALNASGASDHVHSLEGSR